MNPQRRPRPEHPENDQAPQPDAIEGEITENPGRPEPERRRDRPSPRRGRPERGDEHGPADEVRNG